MDTNQKLQLIYGYIRMKICFLESPSDVINLISRFLLFADQWNHSYTSNKVKINTEDNSITVARVYSGLCLAYGKSSIDSKSGAQSWKLKITDDNDSMIAELGWFMIIGITKDDHQMLNKSTLTFRNRWDAQNIVMDLSLVQRRPRNKPMAREPMYHLMT